MTQESVAEGGIPVILPKFGMTMTDGYVNRWLREVGDTVVAGEPLIEVETDKVTMQIESPSSGTLVEISIKAGVEVPVGTVLGRIRDDQ